MMKLLVSALLVTLCSAAVSLNVDGLFDITTASGQTVSAGSTRYIAYLAAVQNINADARYNSVFTLVNRTLDVQSNVPLAQEYTRGYASTSAGFITGLTTGETVAVANAANSSGVPVLISAANSPTFSSPVTYPNVLRNIPEGPDQIPCLVSVIKQYIGTLPIAAAYAVNDTATNPLGTAVQTQLQAAGYTVAGPFQYSTTNPTGGNAAATAQFLSSSGASVFPILVQAADLSKIASALYNLNGTAGQYIIAASDSSLSTASFVQNNSNAALQGLIACALSTPPASAQYTAFQNTYNSIAASLNNTFTPDPKAVYTYDLVYALAEALLANGGNTTNLSSVLRNVNFAGASGQISFAAGSNNIAAKKSYDVYQITGTSLNNIVGSYSTAGALSITGTIRFPAAPTAAPTQAPSGTPTQAPSGTPTQAPSGTPTTTPTRVPTRAPTTTSGASSSLLSVVMCMSVVVLALLL